jgi:hypothetical protein
VFERFGVSGQPAAAVVSPDGEVELLLGAVEPDELDAAIDTALGS